jgi:anti-sigma factor RsiW
MRCERARDLISPYLDDALAGPDRWALATHLQDCANCARLALELHRVARTIAAGGRKHAPLALLARVRASLAQAQELPGSPPPRAHRLAATRALAWRVGLVLAACTLTGCATWWLHTVSERHLRLEHDALTAHLRSLLHASPLAIASADMHAVKPWFSGRLDFSPSVKDLSAEGFELLGGRLDYVGDRRVGALVYKRRLNTINVFVWPDQSREEHAPRLATRQGYNLLIWTHRGLTYCAVSDLSAGELRQMPRLL